MPFAAAPLSVPQAHEEREPSRMGSPSELKATWPIGVSQRWASASVTCGIVPMSAYSAWPVRSAAIVLTQGSPSKRLRIACRRRTDWAWSTARKCENTRKFVRLASARAKADVVVQGSDWPCRLSKIGPHREDHRVWWTRLSPPPERIGTDTLRDVMWWTFPSTR